MPKPLPVRHLHVDPAQPNPLVVIDRPLTERPPPIPLTAHSTGHTLTLALSEQAMSGESPSFLLKEHVPVVTSPDTWHA